jgi:hypothetical protein
VNPLAKISIDTARAEQQNVTMDPKPYYFPPENGESLRVFDGVFSLCSVWAR